MFALIAEALARIEYKIDALLRAAQVPMTPMHFMGPPCPACQQVIDYQIDVQHGFVIRKCGCNTGKVATTPLTPLTMNPGEQPNVRPELTKSARTRLSHRGEEG